MGRYVQISVIYFVSARSFKCTFEPARSKFYKSFNAIFSKVASESVIMQLISSKCLPVLLYATEACPFLARDQSSVSFAVTRVLWKFFELDLAMLLNSVKLCLVCSMLPVEHYVFLRKVRFLLRFKNSDNLIYLLFVDNASSEIKLICKKYSANVNNIYTCIRRSAFGMWLDCLLQLYYYFYLTMFS